MGQLLLWDLPVLFIYFVRVDSDSTFILNLLPCVPPSPRVLAPEGGALEADWVASDTFIDGTSAM